MRPDWRWLALLLAALLVAGCARAVKVKPPKGQYGESNSIRYLAESAPAAPQSMAAPMRPGAPANPAVATSSASLPWKRQG